MKIYIGVFFLIISCYQKQIISNNIQQISPLISMQRTACYGTCPQYTITIYNDGLIRYEGKMFVDKQGCFYSKVSQEMIDKIILKLHEINFFSFKNEYSALMTDVPSVILEVNINVQNHKVIDRFNGPKELKEIQNFIDFISNSITDWDFCT